MKEYVLRIAQSGFAAGEVFDVDATNAGTAENSADIADARAAEDSAEELRRFDEAVLSLKQELDTAAQKADENNAAIFEAEQMLLEDNRYAGAVRRLISDSGQDAASAVRQIGQDLMKEFELSESSYIRARSDDVKGITNRLLELLRGDKKRALTVPSIIVAEELSPLQLSGLDAALILGIITVKGTPSSHVSVIAGNLGIPYVYGSSEAIEAARACSRLIIDGEKLITNPDEEMYRQALQRMEDSRKRAEETLKKEHEKDSAHVSEAGELHERGSIRAELASPVDGKLIPRDEIPDPAFAFGTMWQCLGIMPENGTIYAPCDGIVSGIAATKHAINFTSTDGREILVHVGIDTVSLNGRGFTVLVQEGAAVSKGDIVMEVNLDVIRAAGLSPVVVVAES